MTGVFERDTEVYYIKDPYEGADLQFRMLKVIMYLKVCCILFFVVGVSVRFRSMASPLLVFRYSCVFAG